MSENKNTTGLVEWVNEPGKVITGHLPQTGSGLVKKLCQVMNAIQRVQKRGRNEFHKYDYATEADIVEAVRGELSSRNIFIFPDVETHTRTGDITDIMVAWTFFDGDTGETRVCHVPGSGHDKGDKGVYKALTGSEKYFLMKSFLMPTGDDPEGDERTDKEVGKQAAQAVAAKIKKDKSYVESLFYTRYDQIQMNEITGAEELKFANRDLLKKFWSATAGAIMVTDEQLGTLKVQLKERNVPFAPLKAATVSLKPMPGDEPRK